MRKMFNEQKEEEETIKIQTRNREENQRKIEL